MRGLLAIHLLTALPSVAAEPRTQAPPALPAPPAPAALPDTRAAAPTPSRYASEDLKAYVEALANQLSIRTRATDPFGQAQDPNAKVVVRPTTLAKAPRRPVPELATPLTDIVGRIAITMIKPKDQCFFVAGRSIKQGDQVPLSFRNKQIRTKVTEVSASRIVFRNLDTGEEGIRKLNEPPPGLTQGKGDITVPGMVPSRPNAPLEIESSPPSPAAAAPTNP
ncbi:MAG: hypothetical protein NTW21_40430 [Verrucomicrobia bacterium]|nr:hypothetical protein [Verrucomicrobiota bacterium]